MPSAVAEGIITQELELDGNPALNLASFVTTRFDETTHKLCDRMLPVNWIDFDEYPQTVEIHNRCVNIIAHLFHAPVADGDQAVGTSTVGSSEAIMLAVLAMKWRWRAARKAAGKDYARPNMVMGAEVQVCWEKATAYFDVEARYVPLHDDVYVMDPEQAIAQCDENTIGICGILGTTYTGQFEDIAKLDALVTQMNESKGYDIGIHVDAASGGFVAPFCYPNLKWDFRLKNVRSINVSGHKYGLAPCGIGWLIFRSAEYLPDELVFHVNYLGADQASFTLNFSRGSAQIIASYYLLLRLGRRGYANMMKTLKELAAYFAGRITEDQRFRLLSDAESLPLIAFAIPDDQRPSLGFDEFALAAELRKRGWIVPAYTLAPDLQHQKLLRVVVRVGFTRDRADMLIQDIRAAYDHLRAMSGLLHLVERGLTVADTEGAAKVESAHSATALGKLMHGNKTIEEHVKEFREQHEQPAARHLLHAQSWGTLTVKSGKDHSHNGKHADHHRSRKKRSGAVC
ncbi:hypothetical protein F1559_005100 [Cyanidiococcus yangmingshanensis]|uniref:Glutamate decarboxylase n=1 Tax=Cyanidiococcus yangmingshanensis TaxID=2690220 RepID=A0A7J7IQV6_9RHOD|nr:hypothetical protein F1559_005100 [Cyanidiococcus yangmingshanensis]